MSRAQGGGDLTVGGHGLTPTQVQAGAARLYYGDPESPARPQALIGPDFVSKLDVLDGDVVPANTSQTVKNRAAPYLMESPARVSPSRTV